MVKYNAPWSDILEYCSIKDFGKRLFSSFCLLCHPGICILGYAHPFTRIHLHMEHSPRHLRRLAQWKRSDMWKTYNCS